MLFLTRWFGVTDSDAERSLARERSDIDEIARKVSPDAGECCYQTTPVALSWNAREGHLCSSQFEVFDVAAERDRVLATRLAKGIFAKPGVYPAVVRFANADPNVNSDFKPDVRSLSFSVDLTSEGAAADGRVGRQDFSMQNATTLPINDSPAFLATMKLLTASKQARNPVVAAIRGQVESAENAHAGRIASAPDDQTLSATALLEYRPVPSRTRSTL